MSTPRDMVAILEKLDRGEIVSAEASKEILAIMRRCQDGNGVRRKLSGMTIANKTGALDALRSEVALVNSPNGKIAMAITVDGMKTDWSPDNPGLLMIADLAKLLVDGMGKAPATTSARPAAPATVKTYEVSADRKVTFRLRAPQATLVAVGGDFVQGSQLMQRGDDGVWSVTLGPLKPAIYSYSFRVNGVSVLDPSNPMIKQGESGSASMFEVPGDKLAPYDMQEVPHGTVHVNWYSSKTLDVPRRIDVYTPPGYETSRATYPVLYLLHGSGDTETGWTNCGKADMILDNLIAAGKAKPMIVVMPYGRARRDVYLGPISTAPDANAFEGDLLKDVMPFVEKMYRVSAKADDRAIAGLSMGGGQAMRIGLHHTELFHAVGMFSAAARGQNFEEQYKDLIAPVADRLSAVRHLYVVPDQPLRAAAQLKADLRQLGGLARAGLPRDDHDLVVADRGEDLVLALRERQLRRVAQGKVGHAARIGAGVSTNAYRAASSAGTAGPGWTAPRRTSGPASRPTAPCPSAAVPAQNSDRCSSATTQ